MIFSWLRNRRRRKILDEPFPREWEQILKKNVAHWPRLDAEEQSKLKDGIRILVAEKRWEGANRFPINDEVKVTVAAQAAILLLGLTHDYYARVPSIVIYPHSFEVPDLDEFGDVDDTFPAHVAAGQAVYRGAVILSWSEVLPEGRDLSMGKNVVIHEFAHQLDFLDNVINGTPPLEDEKAAAKWGRVMQAAFDRHLADLKASRETFFTEHAGDNETEFFADASEAFFCVPHDLEEEEPEVYELLMAYYRIDPRKWF
jgi:hypothetical protein